jgi:hypothetical protein
MNPLYVRFVGQVLRWIIGPVAAIFVAKGVITAEQSGEYVNALTSTSSVVSILLFLGQLAWGLYEKYGSQLKLLVALALPKGSTLADVDATIAEKQNSAPEQLPSTKTQMDVAPAVMPSPKR